VIIRALEQHVFVMGTRESRRVALTRKSKDADKSTLWELLSDLYLLDRISL
jgi:hypothetical protein